MEIEKLRDKKEELLEGLKEIDLESRHERHALHEIIHELEEGLHRFEEKEMEEHGSGRNQV